MKDLSEVNIVKEKIAKNKSHSLFYSGEIAYIKFDDGMILSLVVVGEKEITFDDYYLGRLSGEKLESYLIKECTDKDINKFKINDRVLLENWFQIEVSTSELNDVKGITYMEIFGTNWQDVFSNDYIADNYDEGIELLNRVAEDYRVKFANLNLSGV